MKIRWMSIPAVLVCGLLGAGACRGITDQGSGLQRIALDLGHLVGGAVAPPDFVSVLDTARLRVAAGGQETIQVLPLGQSDSTATFEVTVPSGSVRFRLDVFSNNLTPLYVADTTVTIEVDNFAVQLSPRAVNGVMVVWPRNPPYVLITLGRQSFIVARWLLRNAGSSPLVWNVDTLASEGVLSCTVYPSSQSCSSPQTLNQSAVPDTVQVLFRIPNADPDRIITFTSSVGRASFATGIP